jgi:hypothetical protein
MGGGGDEKEDVEEELTKMRVPMIPSATLLNPSFSKSSFTS